MAHSDDDSVEYGNRSRRACVNCKKNKKRCDKHLPACGNCTRKRNTCDYGRANLQRYTHDIKARSERPLTAERSLASSSITAASPRDIGINQTPPASLSNITSGILSSTNLQEPDTVDAHVHSQVLRILDGAGLYVDDITSRYFNGIHKWLAIMSRKRFNRRLLAYQASPNAAFAILLLSMTLVSHHPSISSTTGDTLEAMYLSTKVLFAQVQAYIPSSLCLTQAGLLISTYERSHNQFEAAYVSIGTCARMALAIGLHRRQTMVEELDDEAWSQSREEKNLWWGIVVCDRIIGCEPSILGRPLAVEHPRSDDELPSETTDLDQVTYQPSTKVHQFISTKTASGIGGIGREAQGAYLLSKVLDLVNPARLSVTLPKEIFALDAELQAFLSNLISECGAWGSYCGSIAVGIAALFTLHEAVLSQSRKDSATGVARCKDCSTSALSTITRIIIDISYAFNRKIVNRDINTLSPAYSHMIRAAQQHMAIKEDSRNDTWNEDLESLNKTLGYFHQRWPNAGKQLKILNIGLQTPESSI